MKHLGLIAEDVSDVKVLTLLAKKLTSRKFVVSHFVGKGCGPLMRKTPAWCNNLSIKGCAYVALVHDLDRHSEVDLRARLTAILVCAPQKVKTVVIPREELEAWLLSDESALAKALSLQKIPKAHQNPEMIVSPKEHIGELVRKATNGRKQYVNTVHNPLIAGYLDITLLTKRCPSFSDFASFVRASVK